VGRPEQLATASVLLEFAIRTPAGADDAAAPREPGA